MLEIALLEENEFIIRAGFEVVNNILACEKG